MDFQRSFISFLQVLVVFIFFGFGLFFFALPFLPEVRFQLSDFLLNEPELCNPAAIIFFAAAFFLLLGFYSFNRSRLLYVEMGSHSASVEEALIRHSLEECFKTHFPQKIELSDVEIIGGKTVQIQVSLGSNDIEKQQEMLASAERHLQVLLRQRFGYIKPFYFVLKSTP